MGMLEDPISIRIPVQADGFINFPRFSQDLFTGSTFHTPIECEQLRDRTSR